MNDSRLDAGLRPGISTFPMKHQILTIRLSLQPVFRFCRQIYTQPGERRDRVEPLMVREGAAQQEPNTASIVQHQAAHPADYT